MKTRANCLGILFTAALLFVPWLASAQDAVIVPMDVDFGQVVVGHELTVPVTITSGTSSPLEIFSITITDDPLAAFEVTATDPDPIPLALFEGEAISVFVTFTPVSVGPSLGIMTAHSNDHAREYIEVPVTGVGIAPTPTPTATRIPQGGSCAAAAGCSTGFCVDGVCCDSACLGALEQCDLAGQPGTCVGAVSPAPALSWWGLLATAGVLFAAAFIGVRRRTNLGS